MNNQFLALVATAGIGLALAACGQSTSTTAADAAEARSDAFEDFREDRKDADAEHEASKADTTADREDYASSTEISREKLVKAESNAIVAKARADFSIAQTAAESHYAIEIEKCDVSEDIVDKQACHGQADAEFAGEKAQLAADRDAELARADQHE